MASRIVLRLLAVVTLLLGLGMYLNIFVGRGFRDWHMLFGILTVVAALIILRHPNGRRIAGVNVRRLARFAPLLPLAVGLAMLFGVGAASFAVITLHAVLGFVAIVLIELAISRRRGAEPDVPGKNAS